MTIGKVVVWCVALAAWGLCEWHVDPHAPYLLQVVKRSGLEMSDLEWVHLHHNAPPAFDAPTATIDVNGFREKGGPIDLGDLGLEIRYTLNDTPLSPWLRYPYMYTFGLETKAVANMKSDGFHILSLEHRGPSQSRYKPRAIFLHLSRSGRPIDTRIAIIEGEHQGGHQGRFSHLRAMTAYEQRGERTYPVSGETTPWQTPPWETDLYSELMSPYTELFVAMQMWWEDPFHGVKPNFFVRGMQAKHGEDHRNLRDRFMHERFPAQDGGRGVGWVSPYLSGDVLPNGDLVFAEVSGRVGVMTKDGDVTTKAGWKVKPGHQPVWYQKELDIVRQNMELVGTWPDTGVEPGFKTPLDVAIDGADPTIWYVAGYEDNAIWRVDSETGTVSILAGSTMRAPGTRDGIGLDARLTEPASCTWDALTARLYVVEQGGHAIRAITREGVVTTLYRGAEQVTSVENWNQDANRARSVFLVSEEEGAIGLRPDILYPQTIRVDSQGRILLLELGYGSIRRIDPRTHETVLIADVYQKFEKFDFGWAWMDVDTWGNSGPKDGIYWVKSVGSTIDGETTSRPNEVYAWVPGSGGPSRFVFGVGANNESWGDGWGPIDRTNPPHYPWLVAVIPNGGLWYTGLGNHGVIRVRMRREADIMPGTAQEMHLRYWQGGQKTWEKGTSTSAPLHFRHGHQGHNMLGLRSAWDLNGQEPDGCVLDYFNVSKEIRDDEHKTSNLLYYIRKHATPGSAGLECNP